MLESKDDLKSLRWHLLVVFGIAERVAKELTTERHDLQIQIHFKEHITVRSFHLLGFHSIQDYLRSAFINTKDT